MQLSEIQNHATGGTGLSGHLTTAAGSAASVGTGLWAVASSQPGGPWIAALGTIGGMLTPIAVAWLNRSRSREVAKWKAIAAERETECHRAFDLLTAQIGAKAPAPPNAEPVKPDGH